MATKEEFLNHIAKQLGRERRHGVKPIKYDNNPWDHLYKGFSQEDHIHMFTENLTSLTGNVVRVVNEDELVTVLNELVSKEKVKTAVLWKDSRIEGLKIEQALINKGIMTKVWDKSLDKKELIDFAEQADIGFTYADLGLAETGSILLYNQGNMGRSVSLLPRVFATVLRSKDIKPRITSALKHIYDRHKKEGLPSLINFITGPSRSADIENSLSIGVHGPGIVYVILLDF